ncbi:MAG: hypothetical protein V4547_08940 [Bacteroidota bacterium]
MNIFKEAKESKTRGTGYCATKTVKLSERTTLRYGIRRSDMWQIFPIWNTSHNLQRALLFGVWKVYFEITYRRINQFNQNRKLLFRRKFWKFYQLIS